MAPTKRADESSMKNRDKTKRRKYSTNASTLYKCFNKLCGEECNQDLNTVTEPTSRFRDSVDDMEMDAASEISEDEDLNNRDSDYLKNSRNKPKKNPDFTFKLGMQKARGYICEALAFGVESGYLMPKDHKGQLLKVSSDLLQTMNLSKSTENQSNSNDIDAMTRRRLMRKRQYDLIDKSDNKNTVIDVRKSARSKKHTAVGSRKKRAIKSRSRSKRKGSRMVTGRSSHSKNTEETRPKQPKMDEIEQDDMGMDSKANSSNDNNEDDNEDCKSIKSTKSNKSIPDSDNHDSTQEKKLVEDDISNDDVSEDENNDKKK